MTEEEFGKFMKKAGLIAVIAIAILLIVGFFVLNQFGKETSIFSSQAEIDNYKKKVQEINSREITEKDLEKLEGSEEFQENEESSEPVEGTTETNEQPDSPEASEETPTEEE